jgi:hypothetical protein
MEFYCDIPVYDIREFSDRDRQRITRFNGTSIAVPIDTNYAFVKQGKIFVGIFVSSMRSGHREMKKARQEIIFRRTCPNYIARMACRTPDCIEARV